MTRSRAVATVLGWMLLAAACSGSVETATTEATSTVPSLAPSAGEAPPPPDLDPVLVAEGEALYQQRCAVCHRPDLSGHPDWMTPNDDGSFKPPPHDSTGHTWHHPDQLLVEIVRDGSFPSSPMPSFGDVLSDEDILAILEFFKSSWGPVERGFQWQVTWQLEQPDS